MFLTLTPEAEKTLSQLHTLEFYILCPDGRRFPVENMNKEYEKKPDGIFLRSFQDRLIVVVEAVWPGEKEYNGSQSVMIGVKGGGIYWHQAFYLSTGTSVNWTVGRRASNDLRANTWMPFHGLNIQGSVLKTRYNWETKTYSEVPPTIDGRNFYFEKTNHLEANEFLYTSDLNNTSSSILSRVDTRELKDTDTIETTYASFLPEGQYRNYHSKRSPLFDRFECVSYLLASHALGGNAFTLRTPSANRSIYTLTHTNNSHHFPLIGQGSFEEKFPLLDKRMAPSSPIQDCCIDAAKKVAITKPNEINAFLDKHGAIGRMNAFRVLGESDIQVPGLSLSSVPISNLGYSVPLQDYDHVVTHYVSYIFLKFITKTITKEEVQKQFQLTLPELITLRNQKNKGSEYFLSSEPGFVVTVKEYEGDKNYQGGRKSRRNRRHPRRKLTRKHF